MLYPTKGFSAELCGEKTLERQTTVIANQNFCLTDYGHYLKVNIPYHNSNVTITTSGGTFEGTLDATIKLYSNESWDNDKLEASVDNPNSNDETLSFISPAGIRYFSLGGNVSEMTLYVSVTGGDIPEPLGDFIVYDTNVIVDIPPASLSSKTEFSAIVNEIIAAQESDYSAIAEANPGSIIDVAHAIHYMASLDDINDSDLLALLPYVYPYSYKYYYMPDEEAEIISTALVAVAKMSDFINASDDSSTLHQLYLDALYPFESRTHGRLYAEHLPHILALIQYYSLQSNPYGLPSATDTLIKLMSDFRNTLGYGVSSINLAVNDNMLDTLSVIRSFVLLGETSLDRRWSSDYDLTWFTYYSYYLLANVYMIANDDAQQRIDGIIKEIHQSLSLEVTQAYLEEMISDHFITRANRECTSEDPLFGFCKELVKEEDILTVSFACNSQVTIRAQDSITNDVLTKSCQQLNDHDIKFHNLMKTNNIPVDNDNNDTLEVVVFASPEEYNLYAGDFFGISTNNGGIYLEGTSSNEGNQARFIAMQCPESWVGNSCEAENDIYNLIHEYTHYLDGRYIKAGDYNYYNYNVAWAEGLSEYLAFGDDHPRTLRDSAGLTIPPLYNILFMSYGYDSLYQWSYFAIRYLMESYPEDIQTLISVMQSGDKELYIETLKAISDKSSAGFEDYVLSVSNTTAPIAANIPESNQLGQCTLEQQYVRAYNSPAVDLVTITNTTKLPISLFWINNTTGVVNSSKNYQTLLQGESFTSTFWSQNDRMMLVDSNRNCLAVAVLTDAVNNYTITQEITKNVIEEVLPEQNNLGSCDLMKPHIPKTTSHDFAITNTTNYPVHIFRVNDLTGEPIYSNKYATLAYGESYRADFWYGNRRVMVADARLNCLAVGVTNYTESDFVIEESHIVDAAEPEVLPEDNAIGSCELLEKHLISDESSQFSIVNNSETTMNLYRVDNLTGEIITDFLYATLKQGESFEADYWYNLRRLVLTTENNECLGVGLLSSVTLSNEFTVTASTFDRDEDGVLDINDVFPDDPSESKDSDGDGVGDNADVFPHDPTETKDSDGDGVGDNADAFPNDATETKDSDGDGVGDNADAFPLDPKETHDTDGDGVGDNRDVFPEDPSEHSDMDRDGVGDNADAFPLDATETMDSDGDGVGDNSDAFPNDATETKDSDGDGVGDNADAYPYNALRTDSSVNNSSAGSFNIMMLLVLILSICRRKAKMKVKG
ncbi:collagenase [Colwellia sp. RSH04]|uniref:collagenase n=1 Tax=Colwellia sp. RSH04 TaxID=2305464 RepID=UPI0015FAAA8C|nr:collagenase [Colwellia sp. RSH04]